MNNKANVFEKYYKYVSLIQNWSKPLDDSALTTQVYQNNSPMCFFICGKV